MTQKLSKFAPLVFSSEIRDIKSRLAQIEDGKGFVLMGGDCAESFDEFTVAKVEGLVETLSEMGASLSIGSRRSVLKIGRIAGQFAKPRSESEETQNGVSLPSYRGDIINGHHFTTEARFPDPERMLQGYLQSVQSLNILRYCSTLPKYGLESIMKQRNIESNNFQEGFPIDNIYSSHECLLLPYEEALCRFDDSTQSWYDSSAHFLWIGERTRQLDHGHIHFTSMLANPIGVKISEKITPEHLLQLLDKLNQENQSGKVVLIVRMGASKLNSHLPDLIKAVQNGQRKVVWCCDPMHGNTIKTSTGVKTRDFHTIQQEIQTFVHIHRKLGSHPGGLHLEMTGDANVTECVGGMHQPIAEKDLCHNYRSRCDPRLNSRQAMEIAQYFTSLVA